MSPTEWIARRVGDRILCGRQVDGRYVCQGELARVERLVAGNSVRAGHEIITLPTGFVMDPPGSSHWRLTARSQRQQAAGRKPSHRREPGPDARIGSAPDVPRVLRGLPGPNWTRECPHCGCTARVDSVVLGLAER